jgi:type I restriction enzyme R subunit
VIKTMIDEIERDTPDLEKAVRPLAANPALRNRLIEIKKSHEQVMDESPDEVTSSGFDSAATERARATVESFKAFIEEHKDEITALQILFSIPRRDARRASDEMGRTPSALTYDVIRELAEILQQPPWTWTTESLWRAYATLERDRVRGVNERRVLADLVSLVRHAVLPEEELVPYPERVAGRYFEWVAMQEDIGRAFTPDQHWWLDMIAAHIGVNLSISAEDLNNNPFFEKGGQVAAVKKFGNELPALLDELNQALSL